MVNQKTYPALTVPPGRGSSHMLVARRCRFIHDDKRFFAVSATVSALGFEWPPQLRRALPPRLGRVYQPLETVLMGEKTLREV
jgi:hypothetical protein